MGSTAMSVSLKVPTYVIWGANTGVGKTLISAGLAATATHREQKAICYIKPVQTGFPQDSDAQQVACSSGVDFFCGLHARELLNPTESIPADIPNPSQSPSGFCSLLYAWRQAVSPHLAVEREGRFVPDSEVAAGVSAQLHQFRRVYAAQRESWQLLALVETAGGVASPGPSGNLQCDILRPLRLPAVLVGDPRLGGISATISAYESLLLRGYDVDAVIMTHDDNKLDNHAALQSHFSGIGGAHRSSKPLRVFSVPSCAPAPEGWDLKQGVDPSFQTWMTEAGDSLSTVLQHLTHTHELRVAALREASADGRRKLWWPFTQHTIQNKDTVQVVDGRAGERWLVYKDGLPAGSQEGQTSTDSARAAESLVPLYDAACSWWTQGLPAHLQTELTRAMAHSAGRYMHVIFPQVVHEPALQVSTKLLQLLGSSWASRVFFSDNGSTAIEVALKMAFRKYIVDHGLTQLDDGSGGADIELQVLGLEGGYHGDTLGAMDCVPPSPYNGWLQFPWYRGRGLFLDPPCVAQKDGVFRVQLPKWLEGESASSATMDGILDWSRDTTPLAASYESAIGSKLDEYEQRAGQTGGGKLRLAACIMEPLLQGAAGMQMIDPLFQRTVAKVCRKRGIPVILDEVFTGLWRIGHLSGGQAIGVKPDISAFAKLLTGGSIPLSVTVAREEVFNAFEGSSKLVALLHGHSYTAHPIGCAASVASLSILSDPALNPNLCSPDARPCTCPKTPKCETACGRLTPLWDEEEVKQISMLPNVTRAQALGTVLTIEVQAPKGESTGYASTATADIARQLTASGVYVRPLGTVLYLMVTPLTSTDTCKSLLGKLKAALSASS